MGVSSIHVLSFPVYAAFVNQVMIQNFEPRFTYLAPLIDSIVAIICLFPLSNWLWMRGTGLRFQIYYFSPISNICRFLVWCKLIHFWDANWFLILIPAFVLCVVIYVILCKENGKIHCPKAIFFFFCALVTSPLSPLLEPLILFAIRNGIERFKIALLVFSGAYGIANIIYAVAVVRCEDKKQKSKYEWPG